MPEPLSVCLLRWLASAIVQYLPPRKPGRFTLRVTDQDQATMKITATLPEKNALDVASYELTYTVDANPPVIATSTGDPITFSAPTGSKVVATFVQIDGAGNRSEPSDPVELTVIDSIAPPKSGPGSLAVTGEDA
jgi:hypothetical protein